MTISNRQQQIVSDILSGGSYGTEEEVLDEALELLRQRDELRRRLRVADEQLKRGEGIPFDRLFELRPNSM
jgi:Arc/MetJ-type ribon-helix-helix transcriptional regulator